MNTAEFKNWINLQNEDWYRIENTKENEIHLVTEFAEGSVIFHDQDIIELTVTDKDSGEALFYLHFQLKDEAHAKSLFREMKDVMSRIKEHRKTKVLLTCSSGLTTSFFAQELNKAAASLKLDYEFSAVSFSHLFEKGFDYDVILIAPQISFEYPKAKEIFRSQIVMNIPAAVFGGYNTGKLIEMVMHMKDQQAMRKEEAGTRRPDDPFENNYRILALCLINHRNMYRFGYRIYDHGKRTLDKEVIKQTFGPRDIEDLMDYIVARHKDIDAIALAVPGVTYRGVVSHQEYKFINRNLGKELSGKYRIPVILINDVNALALGYHAVHLKEKNMVFYFQPRGYAQPGAGLIINDRLYTGRLHAAGEIAGIVRKYTDRPDEKIMTPEGAMEFVCAGLAMYISTTAPDTIILYSELTPNEKEIREYLSDIIKEEYIPEIRHVRRLKKYMLPGAMIHCLDVLAEEPEWIRELKETEGEKA